MAEYIKRDDVEKILFNIMYEEPPYIDSDIAIKRWAEEQMADVPSLDIVHCEDCSYQGTVDCPMDEQYADDYCSYGARKE